jgi:RNA polymerase sigma-70 factor (ECF subfamily)
LARNPEEDDITVLLRRASAGDREAEGALIPLIYQDLRKLAMKCMRGERADHSLQPTALVHEAYLRLMGSKNIEWQDRTHFFRLGAGLMRRILVDHARGRKADKRGGAQIQIPLDDFLAFTEENIDLILTVDQALTRLAEMDARQADIIEMRFFSGLSEEEIAAILQISPRTVRRESTMAKAFLKGELTRPD